MVEGQAEAHVDPAFAQKVCVGCEASGGGDEAVLDLLLKKAIVSGAIDGVAWWTVAVLAGSSILGIQMLEWAKVKPLRRLDQRPDFVRKSRFGRLDDQASSRNVAPKLGGEHRCRSWSHGRSWNEGFCRQLRLGHHRVKVKLS
jgi:hypothetical protein